MLRASASSTGPMMDLGKPASIDDARLGALARYAILDTAPEPGFDDIVLLASRICETPVALVSLVTDNRQWFKARVGFPLCETPLSQSVCAHALLIKGLLIIPDLTLDERTRHNTLVTGEPFIRFYAGAVLETPDGIALGTLCVIDTMPRPEGLTPTQAESLQALARQVVSQMDLRRALVAAAVAEAAAERHQEMLRSELGHRLKNILAVVQAIVSQTLRGASDVDEARRVVLDRILALGRAQDLLLVGTIERAGLAALVRAAADLYHNDPDRFLVSGPDIEIGPRSALSLALMLHELGTNAAKYGALSAPEGRVTVSWTLTAAPEPVVELIWREEGGPPIAAPSRRGFGTRLIERALADEVGSPTILSYPPTGVVCRLVAPLVRLQDGSGEPAWPSSGSAPGPVAG